MIVKPYKKLVNIIGIGGIGISALARWFLAQNWAVSGSDTISSSLTQELKKEGVEVKIGHKKANLPAKNDLVVYSKAILPQNPELAEARRRGLKIMSYPEALGELTRHYQTIAVAGAHGKSTTTALLSLILIKAGFDPTVIIGAKLKELKNKNFRAGKSNWLIIEADEWQASFLNYSPAAAVITNLDREHLDFYKNFSNIKKTFLKFIINVANGGLLVLNADDKNLRSLKIKIEKIGRRKNLKIVWYSLKNKMALAVKKILKIPGRHNWSNAVGAYTLASQLKIKKDVILKTLNSYRGIWRRMEFRGYLNPKPYSLKVPVYDDYAHHPTEIKATLAAFKEKLPRSPLFCVFQPHQAERLKLLFKDFIGAFNQADALILLPVYRVAGRDKIDQKFSSEMLAKKIPGSIYLKNPELLPQTIKKIINLNPKFYSLNPIVVMMGAGDIANYTQLLI